MWKRLWHSKKISEKCIKKIKKVKLTSSRNQTKVYLQQRLVQFIMFSFGKYFVLIKSDNSNKFWSEHIFIWSITFKGELYLWYTIWIYWFLCFNRNWRYFICSYCKNWWVMLKFTLIYERCLFICWWVSY